MSKINPKWTSHLPTKDRDSLAISVQGSKVALDRLSDIIKQRIASLECPKTVDYDTASWAFKQADRIGQIRACKEILKLTDL